MYSLMYPLLCCYISMAAAALANAAGNTYHFWDYEETCQHYNSIINKTDEQLTKFQQTQIKCTDVSDEIKSDICADYKSKFNNVRLLCREFDSLTYTWDYPMNDNTSTSKLVVAVELISHCCNNETEPKTHLSKISTGSYIRFENLESKTWYAARVRLVTKNGTLCRQPVVDVQSEHTLDKSATPEPVESLNVTYKFDVTKAPKPLSTLLKWKLSPDKNCHYKIIYYPNHYIDVRYPIVDEAEKTGSFKLTNLSQDTQYTVKMCPSYQKNNRKDNSCKDFTFYTPKCLDSKPSEECPPLQPTNLTIKLYNRKDGLYNVNMSWKGSDYAEFYTVKMSSESKNVTGNTSEALFENINLNDTYLASVQAFNRNGGSPELKLQLLPPIAKPSSGSNYYLWTTVVVLALFAVAVVGKHVHQKKMAVRKALEITAYELNVLKGLEDVDLLMDRKNVVVTEEQLGRGHFGVVRKGLVKTEATGEYPVAVKSLQGRPSSRDMDMFLGEILLMQKVGKHPNIVSMVGCCVDVNSRCMLIVEFCPLGDLLTYLRKVNMKPWYSNELGDLKTMLANWQDGNEATTTTSPVVSNNCYMYHNEQEIFLSSGDLLRFASQAANGMVFLEKNRIVHRDLAARNVLLSDHHTIKICDFGLSRDVYEQNLYTKSKDGDPLPVKWMALESLKHRVYTTQSDVWSFGVLLWEITTLGGCPYPSVQSAKLYEVLRRGYRMSKPALCSDRLYKVMLECWHPEPNKRPKFVSIKDTIDSIIEKQNE
ncbi:tyrosine-protein kinase receptor torso-like [Adelges cooleyi]|uniref:tyrosine-protein kinase receptor torso-like n=1 Tax=Adelges cooleyi TaxID=133065 RepID=UPI00217F5E1A|nr:tyrosine-protein kinase receptor torso-like [Adelges cooleyi]